MDNWFADLTAWLWQLVKDFFGALFDLVYDLILFVFDGILSALAAVIGAIPAPQFLQDINVGQAFTGFPGFALFVLNQLNLPAALSLVAAAFAFRMIRKAVTLFQW